MADNNEREPDRDEQSGIHCGESRVGGKHGINEPLEAAGLIDAGGQGHREAELDECRPGKVRADILEGADADAGAEHQEDGDKNDVVGSDMVDAVGAECKQSQGEVDSGLLFLDGQGAHLFELLLCKLDVDAALLALAGAEEEVCDEGDEQDDDSGGDAGGLEPARPGDGLSGHFLNECHTDGVCADCGVEQPGVGGVGVEVGEHDGGVALMFSALVAHALADVVADGAHNGAACGVGGDHQGQDGVCKAGRVVCAQLALGELDKYPVCDAFAETGELDDGADEAGPQTQPPAGGRKAGDDVCLLAEEYCEDGGGEYADEVFGDGSDDPHEDSPQEHQKNALAGRVKAAHRYKCEHRTKDSQDRCSDQTFLLHLFFSLLKNVLVLNIEEVRIRFICTPRGKTKPTTPPKRCAYRTINTAYRKCSWHSMSSPAFGISGRHQINRIFTLFRLYKLYITFCFYCKYR